MLPEDFRQFSAKGYSGISISSIIDAAGASKVGLCNHFPNKDQLCRETLSLAGKIWREKICAASTAGSPTESVAGNHS